MPCYVFYYREIEFSLLFAFVAFCCCVCLLRFRFYFLVWYYILGPFVILWRQVGPACLNYAQEITRLEI